MPLFEAPASHRLRDLGLHLVRRSAVPNVQTPLLMAVGNATMHVLAEKLPPHSQHPDFLHLAGLVCEAVLEVVFVALPGFLVAWTGMFDANSQRFVAELNTMVFTPCLIFTKLASQLDADTLIDLAIIPVIFLVQTFISWCCAQSMSRAFGFNGPAKKRQKNFILAMGVFGNSNSLPISLVISLSKTISGLHWEKIQGDNDNEVAARGILYLLIFQQLGQLLRWTWGYSVLLKPEHEYDAEERGEDPTAGLEEEGRYRDEPDDLIGNGSGRKKTNRRMTSSDYGSGSQTAGSSSSLSSLTSTPSAERERVFIGATPGQGNNISTEPRNLTTPQQTNGSLSRITTFPSIASHTPPADLPAWKHPFHHIHAHLLRAYNSTTTTLTTTSHALFARLPPPLQRILSSLTHFLTAFLRGAWRQMNPPLWAMLAALTVASIPKLQHLFFDPGTFVANSISRAIAQSGSVAVPLILVVLGANLARSTVPPAARASTPAAIREQRALLAASLLSRMLLPVLIVAPLLALAAKYIPVSILADPIFVVVCFLLTGAPSALQLAQICQVNEVFMGVMSSLLLASYVFAIFPSTLALVMLALEVVEWRGA